MGLGAKSCCTVSGVFDIKLIGELRCLKTEQEFLLNQERAATDM